MQKQNTLVMASPRAARKRKLILTAAAAAAVHLFVSDSTSESDDDEDFVFLTNAYLQNVTKKSKVDMPRPRSAQKDTAGPGLASSTPKMSHISVPRLETTSRMDVIVPDSITTCPLSYADFRSTFKLSRKSVEMLLRLVVANLDPNAIRPKIPMEKTIMIFLWILVSRESFPDLARRFGYNVSEAYEAFSFFSNALKDTEELAITWPTGADAMKNIKHFESSTPELNNAFPGTFGCIGTLHIEVPDIRRFIHTHKNRFGYTSIVLQAVCDSTGRFLDTSVWPGSSSDCKVWENSRLCFELQLDPNLLPHDTHLLGHESYPLSTNLMIPYTDGGILDDCQILFNSVLTSQRSVIQKSLTKLVKCFQRLKMLNNPLLLDIANDLISAACICYNLMLSEKTEDEDSDAGEYDEIMEMSLELGEYKETNEDLELDAEAVIKRDQIAQFISFSCAVDTLDDRQSETTNGDSMDTYMSQQKGIKKKSNDANGESENVQDVESAAEQEEDCDDGDVKTAVRLSSTSPATPVIGKHAKEVETHDDEEGDVETTTSSTSTAPDESVDLNSASRLESRWDALIPQAVSASPLSSADFRNVFKLSRSSVERLCRVVSRTLVATSARPRMPTKKGTLLFLWVLSTTESFPSVAKRFGLSVSTTYQTFFTFTEALECSEEVCITWPRGAEALKNIRDFEINSPGACKSFPGTFGCIGTMHIKIADFRNVNANHCNRFGFLTVVLQAVCDSSGRFINVCSKSPGFYTDATVWRTSDLYNCISDMLPSDTHLLGHDAYPLSTNLLTPYADNGALNDCQTKYNCVLNSTRAIIERALIKLKRLFTRLTFVDIRSVEKVASFVYAACVCYNLALEEGNNDDDDSCDEFTQMSLEVGQYVELGEELMADKEAIAKRDQIAACISLDQTTPDQCIQLNSWKRHVDVATDEKIKLGTGTGCIAPLGGKSNQQKRTNIQSNQGISASGNYLRAEEVKLEVEDSEHEDSEDEDSGDMEIASGSPYSSPATPVNDSYLYAEEIKSDYEDLGRPIDADRVTLPSAQDESLGVRSNSFKRRIARLDKYVPHDISASPLSDADFQNSFKLSRTCVERLLQSLIPAFNAGSGRPRIPTEQGVLLFLWVLGTTESFRAVAKRFRLSKSTTYQTYFAIIKTLKSIEELRITWPTGDDATKNIEVFERNAAGVCNNFPGTFGCIGTMHIKIAYNPKKSIICSNRFGYPSVVLQAVCDSSGRFINVSVTSPGSYADAKVWRTSDLYNCLSYILPSDTHLLGHDAYPLSTNLLTPYADNGALNECQTKYNFVLNNTREMLEKTFIKLRRIFSRLTCVETNSIDKVSSIVTAACMMCNLALEESGNDEDDDDRGYDELTQMSLEVGQYEEIDEDIMADEEAIAKRDQIATIIFLDQNKYPNESDEEAEAIIDSLSQFVTLNGKVAQITDEQIARDVKVEVEDVEEGVEPAPSPPPATLDADHITVSNSLERRISRLNDFVPLKVSDVPLSDAAFRNLFKLSRTSVEKLLRSLIPEFTVKVGRPRMATEKGTLFFLWILGTTESLSSVASRFGMSRSRAHETFFVFAEALERSEELCITWPTGADADKNLKGFQKSVPEEVCNTFPGTFGCIGAMHIKIPGFLKHSVNHCNRFDFPSVVLQAVCDSSGRFINVSGEGPGSYTDAKVWRTSDLYKSLSDILPSDTHLLGHDAYPLSTNLLTPYADNGALNECQTKYNCVLNSTRAIIERALIKLKRLFTRLTFVDIRSVEKVSSFVTAACILYNLALEESDNESDDGGRDDEEVAQMSVEVGQFQEVDEELDIDDEAIAKRDKIAAIISRVGNEPENEEDEDVYLPSELLDADLILHVPSGLERKLLQYDSYVPESISVGPLSAADFRNTFTLSRKSVEMLLRILIPRFAIKPGRPRMPIEKGVLLFLWILNTKESFTAVAKRFVISKTVTYMTFFAIAEEFERFEEFRITWPTGADATKVIRDFELTNPGAAGPFPGTFGCIGAAHVKIGEFKDKKSINYNRFGYPSVVLQAVCDSSGRFIDIATSPGSCTDSQVWRSSPLFEKLQKDPGLVPAYSHLLGHQAYPLSTVMMTPYSNVGVLDERQLKYNVAINSQRRVVDKALVKLKLKFKRLQFIDTRLTERAAHFISAACICYNIAVEEGLSDDGDDGDDSEDTAVMKRSLLVGRYNEVHENVHENVMRKGDRTKRNKLADIIFCR